MKRVVTFIAFFIAIQIFSQTTISKNVGDFTKIKVFNGINVELIKSDEQKVVITGAKAEKVKIKNSNNTLRILLKFPEINADNNVEVKLYYKNKINIIDANGGGNITGKITDQLQLEVKSQEKAFVNLDIQVKHLIIKTTQGGIVKLSGSAKNQDVDIDLYGVYHGYNLKVTDNTTVKAGLGTKAEVFAGEILNAKVSFGGSVFYKGDPEVIKDKKVVGGIIKKKES